MPHFLAIIVWLLDVASTENLCVEHGITKYGIHSLAQIALAMDKELTN